MEYVGACIRLNYRWLVLGTHWDAVLLFLYIVLIIVLLFCSTFKGQWVRAWMRGVTSVYNQ